MLRHQVGVPTVERPDPKGLSTFSQSTDFPAAQGIQTQFKLQIYVERRSNYMAS
jgi:hypothetical protein